MPLPVQREQHYGFSRAFRLFNRLFSNAPITGPSSVGDRVQLVCEMFKNTFMQDVRLNVDTVTNGAPGAGNQTLSHAEPPAGFVQIPLLWAAEQGDAVARQVNAILDTTASVPLDPWGRWSASTITLHATLAPATSRTVLLRPVPVFRGHVLRVDFIALTGGNAITTKVMSLLVPGELADLSLFMAMASQPNFVFNSPV